MTNRQKRNYILMMLVMCIVLGGVCFEKIQADSFFAWGKTQVVSDTINDHEETMEDSLCMGRVLQGSLDTRAVKANIQEQSKMYMRIFMSPLFVCLLPQVFTYIFEATADGLFQNNKSHAVIMRFIHTQDGKKE